MRILLSGAAKKYRIVGLFGFGDTTDFGAVTFAAFDLATAQREFDAGASIDAVYVQRDPDVPDAVLQAAHRSRALGPAYEVLTADEATLQVGKPVRQFLGFFTDALLGFAAIGVVVGAFIIFNTFTILVAQRTRELGLLRAMGATGGQVVRSVVLEAFVVGAVASLLGLVAGIALGVGLLELLRALGLDLPDTSVVVEPRTVVVSLVVGVLVTVVAALVPAWRAARVPPVAAIADVPARAVGGFVGRVVAGLVVLAVGIGAPRVRAGPGPRRQRAHRPGAGGRARRVRRAGRRRADPARGRASGGARDRRAVAAARSARRAGARERDAQPASHRDHRVGAGDRARAGRADRDVRRVGARVGRSEHRRPDCAPTTW